MKKRKNKFLPLILLTVLLALLLIGYSLLSAANERKAAEEAQKEQEAAAGTVIAAYDPTTMVSLYYEIPAMDPVSLVREGGTWYSAEDKLFPLDSSLVDYMATFISDISAVATVTAGTKEDYGLDAPTHLIRVAYEDGSSHTYTVGNFNFFNQSYYFAMDDEIYMIAPALLSCFQYGLEDLMDLDAIPYSDWKDTANVTEITVKSGGYANSVSDTDGISGLLSALNGIYLDEWYDYYAEAEEKTAYGLDGTTAVTVKYKKALTVTDADGNTTTSYPQSSYTLYFGSATEDGERYYIAPEGSDIVYVTDSEDVINVISYLFYFPSEETEPEDTAETAPTDEA